MNIGLKIKELREEKNMSQEELADKIGVTKQMISHYEGGINVPRSKKIKKIAEIFKITEEEFYTSKTTLNLTNIEKSSISREQITQELISVNKKYQALLEKGNADKDKIIELMEEVDRLKEKLRNVS